MKEKTFARLRGQVVSILPRLTSTTGSPTCSNAPAIFCTATIATEPFIEDLLHSVFIFSKQKTRTTLGTGLDSWKILNMNL
jgi:hypothetical protein